MLRIEVFFFQIFICASLEDKTDFPVQEQLSSLFGGHSPLRNGSISLNTKEIKNAPECIVELYKHAGIFKNTKEVHREARGAAECFSHFSSVLKNSQVLE